MRKFGAGKGNPERRVHTLALEHFKQYANVVDLLPAHIVEGPVEHAR
jgi:hypothetical protein